MVVVLQMKGMTICKESANGNRVDRNVEERHLTPWSLVMIVVTLQRIRSFLFYALIMFRTFGNRLILMSLSSEVIPSVVEIVYDEVDVISADRRCSFQCRGSLDRFPGRRQTRPSI